MKPDNDVRDVIKKEVNTYWDAEKPYVPDDCKFSILLRDFSYAAEWAIDYQTKRLAEMAGQRFDEADYKRDGLDLKTAKLVHERTATAYEAKIVHLTEELMHIENRVLNKAADKAVLWHEQLAAMKQERDEALAKLAKLEDTIDSNNIKGEDT